MIENEHIRTEKVGGVGERIDLFSTEASVE